MHMGAAMNAHQQPTAQSPGSEPHMRIDLTDQSDLRLSNVRGEQLLAAFAIKLLRDHLSRLTGPSPLRSQHGSPVGPDCGPPPSRLAWSHS
jgi:hypothetical protein